MRFKTLWRFAAVGTVAALAAAGCSSSKGSSSSTPGSGGARQPEITIGRFQAFDGWNPDSAVSLSTAQTLPAVYDTLLHFSDDGTKVIPGVAKSWTFDAAAKTYTFKLQDKAGFPNGKPVTSADVAFSVGHWKAGPQYGAVYATIESVDTPDPKTVVFHLTVADTFLPVVLTWGTAGIMPANYGGMSADEFFGGKPYGAGPFSVESSTAGEEIVLTKNPNYWGSGPGADRLVYREYLSPDAATVAFEDGKIDAIELLQVDRAARLPGKTGVLIAPAAATTIAIPNHAREITGNLEFRKALSLALNRTDLAAVYGGNARLAKGIMPCCLPGSTGAEGDWNKQDLAAARKALKASGLDKPSITINYDSALDLDRSVAEVMQSQLGKIGITVNVEGVDTATFLGLAIGGEYDVLITGIVPVSPSIGDPLAFYRATGYYFSGAPEAADLAVAADKFEVAPDPATRRSIIRGVENQAFDEKILIPLVSPNIGFAVSQNLSGMKITPWGMYYTNTLAVSK